MRNPVRPLNEDENKEFNNFFEPIVGKLTKRFDEQAITTMFNYNNNIYPMNKEFSKSCGGCRLRVYNRLLEYYNSIPKEELKLIEVEVPIIEIKPIIVKKPVAKKVIKKKKKPIKKK